MTDKDVKALVRLLRKLGAVVTQTGSDHYKVEGEGKGITFMASTPGDRRAMLNARAKLRRSGWKV